MTIIPCEYGKYACIDIDSIIQRRTKEKNKNGSFHFNFIPIIAWKIDKDGYSTPVLIDNEIYKLHAIVDLKTKNWWWDMGRGNDLSSLSEEVLSYIEYAIDNPNENDL